MPEETTKEEEGEKSEKKVSDGQIEDDQVGDVVEKNETIAKIEELLEYLLSNPGTSTFVPDGDSQSMDTSAASVNGIWFTANASASGQLNTSQTVETTVNIAQMPTYTYAELLALYEKEKTFRLELESNFQQKAKESNKQVWI